MLTVCRTLCKVFVSPLMTRENLCLLTFTKHSLFCLTFCMDCVVWRPVLMGSWTYVANKKISKDESMFTYWNQTERTSTMKNLSRKTDFKNESVCENQFIYEPTVAPRDRALQWYSLTLVWKEWIKIDFSL